MFTVLLLYYRKLLSAGHPTACWDSALKVVDPADIRDTDSDTDTDSVQITLVPCNQEMLIPTPSAPRAAVFVPDMCKKISYRHLLKDKSQVWFCSENGD